MEDHPGHLSVGIGLDFSLTRVELDVVLVGLAGWVLMEQPISAACQKGGSWAQLG